MDIVSEREPDRLKPPYLVPSLPTACGPDFPRPNSGFAISVRRAYMQYSDVSAILSTGRPKKETVLKNFNMSVQRGHIYGLLGASGCGKTTLLRGIVGELRFTSGEIRVLGHEPKSPDSGIPGTTVGYMPQDLSLLEDLTIMENLRYYGMLGDMDNREIETQAEHLSKLLELPPKNRLVTTLSGGQRRRVSFAIALLYSPPVLVLDEPTVGVDPLLRESIWQYLIHIAKKEGTTVLITTHYIEEATQADTVGLMRYGELMAEDSPRKLIELLRCVNLEEVLLKLCLRQSSHKMSHSPTNDIPDVTVLPKVNTADVTVEASTFVSRRVSSLKKIKALVWKDLLVLFRHYVFLALFVFLPGLITLLFAVSTGTPLKGLRVSVVNQETDCLLSGVVLGNKYVHNNDSLYCQRPGDFSCKILSHLGDKDIEPILCENEELARDEVRRGRAWAAITFQENFTASLIERASWTSPLDAVEATISRGTIHITMDDSNRVISFSIRRDLVDVIKKILAEFDDECHKIRHLRDFPIQYKPPVYGSYLANMRDSVFPGAIASLALMFPLTGTLSALLPEITQGTLARSLVAGVTMKEVIIAHFVSQLAPIIMQILLIYAASFGVFDLYVATNILTAMLVTFLIAICGMVFGFLLASVCSRVTTASLIGTGLYFSCIFTSGTIWPLEGVPSYFLPFCLMMPLTKPTEALRHATQRGWTFAYSSIQLAAVFITAWCIVLLVALVAVWRYRQR